MRTLVKATLNGTGDRENEVRQWLESSGFRPEPASIKAESFKTLLGNERPDINQLEAISHLQVAERHALEMLSTIPLSDQEREHALEKAKFSIHFDDPHGNMVWGLVCIDAPAVTFRWRHKISHSLEQATEELVTKIWENSGDAGLFKPLHSKLIIPVREPFITSDAYIGEVVPPGPERKRRAKAEKKTELNISWLMGLATVIFFILGFVLFFLSGKNPDSIMRWCSGAADRLATTAAATAIVSYLNYFFHLRELQSKPIIDWK